MNNQLFMLARLPVTQNESLDCSVFHQIPFFEN